MISFDRVNLVECFVGAIAPGRPLHYNVQITHLDRAESVDGGGRRLVVIVGFDFLSGVKDPACGLRCTFQATYLCGESETFDPIKDHIAVAHLVPFVREFAWNLTSRMAIGALMIPPIQTLELIERYQKNQAAGGASPVISDKVGPTETPASTTPP